MMRPKTWPQERRKGDTVEQDHGRDRRAAHAPRNGALAESSRIAEVILFDEPTSALDPVGGQKIEALIVDPKRDFTIVIVRHDTEQAQRCADKVAFSILAR